MLSSCQLHPPSSLKPVAFEDLPGWEKEDFKDAPEAWAASCRYFSQLQKDSVSPISTQKWQGVCQVSKNYDFKKPSAFRKFLTTHFNVFQIQDPGNGNKGLFTGYYEPVLQGSKIPASGYKYPIYKRPPELIVIEDLGIFRSSLQGHRIAGTVEGGTLKPYWSRRQIDQGALKDRQLEWVWVKDRLDLFWMHIQGSGRIVFEDGTDLRLVYNGTNGHSYTAIGTLIRKKANVSAQQITMDFLKHWLREHPSLINEILWLNSSYVFFKTLPPLSNGPIGRLQEPLVPMRSLAVDPVHIPLGSPLWLDTEGPGDTPPIQRLFFGQDVGGAIKGPIRGDIYWGSGDEAGHLAGMTNSKGSLYLFLPR